MVFHDPHYLKNFAVKEMGVIPGSRLFNEPGHQKIRETWCAAVFGLGYEKYIRNCQIAINETRENPDVDFYLKTNNKVFPFQITERQMEGRRRGEEWIKRDLGINEPLPYRPLQGELDGPSWIENAIAKKVAKQYAGSKGLNLLVYANFTAPNLKYSEVKEKVLEHHEKFASIWIISDRIIGSLFSNEELGVISGWGHVHNEWLPQETLLSP